MIAPLFVIVAMLAAPSDQLAQIERAITDIEPQRALFETPSAPDPTHAINALRSQLNSIERDLRTQLTRIDASENLLTDPNVREKRSAIAVADLRLRLPAARARLTALDPHATDADLASAIAEMQSIDFAWGEPARARAAALGALLLRTNRAAEALDYFIDADPADPLTRLGRTAGRAATETLDRIPTEPHLLEAALHGAAQSAQRITAAADLAERALTEAPEHALPEVRATIYNTLRVLTRRHGARPPLVRVALAQKPDDLFRIVDLNPRTRSILTLAEAHWRLWETQHDHVSLLESALIHPSTAARSLSATQYTAYLEAAPRTEYTNAKALYDSLPEHPLRSRWLLMYAEAAPVYDALVALDANTDPAINSAALLLAARRAHDAFTASPADRNARNRLIHRAGAARRSGVSPEWHAWLLRATAEAKLAKLGPLEASAWLLKQPSENAAQAARFLSSEALNTALAAEARDNPSTQRAAAGVADQLAMIASDPVARARALTLADDPSAALDAIRDAPASAERDLARAEALFQLQRDDEAFPLFRSIAESHETHRRDSDAYWRSWTRLLQIVERSAGESRDEEIAREINRLRYQDQRLGGDPHRRRLESLESRVSAAPPRPRSR